MQTVEALERGGLQRQEEARAPIGKKKASEATNNRQEQALSQCLANQAGFPCAKRRTNHQLLLARSGASDQQTSEIRAGNQQHEHHGSKENQQRRANITGHKFMQGKENLLTASLGVGILFGEPAVDGGHLRLRLCERNTRIQPPVGVHEVDAAKRGRLRVPHPERDKDVGVLSG